MGTYRGKSVSDESVKKRTTFQGIDVYIDRPKGFEMSGTDASGKPWTRTYKYDYGFIPKTLGGDDDGLDVFMGPDATETTTYWVTQSKSDGSFDEYKVFLGFPSKEAAVQAFKDHIPARFLRGVVALEVGIMKSMLGINPEVKLAASLRACLRVLRASP